jgi:hypothetical protein
VPAIFFIETSPKVIVDASITIPHQKVHQPGPEKRWEIDPVIRVLPEMAEKVICLHDAVGTSEARLPVSEIVGPFLEEHEHTRELLPELPEPRVVRYDQELRFGVKDPHRVQKPGHDDGAGGVEGAELISHDRFNRGSPKLLRQCLPRRLLDRAEHVPSTVSPHRMEGPGGHSAPHPEGGKPPSAEFTEVGYRDLDCRRPQRAISRPGEG